MNAAVMADGFAASGSEGARVALEAFWRRVARAATFRPFRRTPLDMALGRWSLDYSPAFVLMDLLTRFVSPYELAPWAPNPLEAVLAESVDFGRLARAPIKVVCHRHECTYRPRPRLPQRRHYAAGAAGLAPPSDAVPGHRDRWRGRLGWRLLRQPD
jgi:hypothetical protein